MIFDLKHTVIYQAVKIDKSFPIKLINFFKWLFLIIALVLFIVLTTNNPLPIFSSSTNIFGLFLIVISFGILIWIWQLFFNTYLKENIYLKLSIKEAFSLLDVEDINLAQYLDFKLVKATNRALRFCKNKQRSLKAVYVILFLLNDPQVQRILDKLNLRKKDIKELIELNIKESKDSNLLYHDSFLRVVKEAASLAVDNFHRQIEIRDFLVATANSDDYFRKLLFEKNLNSTDINHVMAWDDFITIEAEWKKKFWRLENLLRKPGIGKQWAAGHTVNVDKYAIDVTKLIKEKNLPLHTIGRKKEIQDIERVLSRRVENNTLVLGRPGGGRSTIVYSFAKRVLEGNSVPQLNYKRVLELDIQALFAGLKTTGEALARFKLVFSEAISAGNIILIIDNIHNYIGSQESLGGLDISSALIPYLSSPELQIIGISTFQGFHKKIEPNPSIMNFFEKIEIEEPSKEETMFILEDLLPGFIKRYELKVGYKALRTIVKLTDRYIQDSPFPEKAIDFLGEVMSYVKTQTNSKKVLEKHVSKLLSQKTGIPAGEIQKDEKEKLLLLEQLIHNRVINQEKAVNALADAMRRTRAGVTGQKRPIGTFLFLGPTGVGKTETSKALAESYFGSEKRMIRLDMSEYQNTDSINQLIGSSDGKQQGLLTNAIRENPFSLLLLDEIEKANTNILNLFLQILDEGRLTDALGRTVDFCNAIIIGTSNAGAEFIRGYLKKESKYEHSEFKKKLIDYLLKNGIFKPEFLNRFDATIIFKTLTKENLIKIAFLMLKKLNERLMQGRGIRLIITKELAEKVAELGYEPEFGARPMNRVIQDKIENQIAEKILRSEVHRGDVVEINPKQISNIK